MNPDKIQVDELNISKKKAVKFSSKCKTQSDKRNRFIIKLKNPINTNAEFSG